MDVDLISFIACAGKQQFEKADDAAAAVRRQRRGKGRDSKRVKLGLYKCEFCGFFHIGHDRKNRIRKR